MSKRLSGFIFSLVLLSLISQQSKSQTTFYHRYIIEFTDKSNSPYSLGNPSEYLSQRAIDRRTRYNIPIAESDLPVNSSYIQAVLATGVKLLNRSKWLNSISIQTDDSLALVAINELPFVKSSAPIALRKSDPSIIQQNKFEDEDASLPNGILQDKLDDVDPNDYGTAWHQLNMLHADVLHSKGYRGDGIVIAILDGGFYNTKDSLDIFDSLFNDNLILGVWNFVKGTDTVYGYATHGTEVLSSIAANKRGFMIGTAPDVSVYLFVTEDVNTESLIEEHNWAAGAEMADSLGADMISSSLGYSEFDDPSFNHTYADMNGKTCMSSRAAAMAARKGMIVCSSAGNQGQHPWHYITAPADADSIITTGATDSIGTFTAFSSQGPSFDGRVKPTVVALGIRAWVIDPAPKDSSTFPGNGTSFSNPILAGATACLWQAHKDKNNMQIIDAIERSASRYYSPDDSFGFGIPNFQIADSILHLEDEKRLFTEAPLVYPNPFAESFTIIFNESSPEHSDVSVEIFDCIGRKISSFPFATSLLPVTVLSHAANGVYILKVKFNDHDDIIRVVKAQQ